MSCHSGAIFIELFSMWGVTLSKYIHFLFFLFKRDMHFQIHDFILGYLKNRFFPPPPPLVLNAVWAPVS